MDSIIINVANEEACHRQDNFIQDMSDLTEKAHCPWLEWILSLR